MALQKSWDAPTGITHAAAYFRVIAVTLALDPPGVTIALKTYAAKATRDAGKEPIRSFSYPLDGSETRRAFDLTRLDTRNPVGAAYDWLKARPEYADALDV